MIIINCKNRCSNNNKTIFCEEKNYIISVEYIDNEYGDVLTKESFFSDICYFNLNGDYHNPIGPAYIEFDENGKKICEEYFIDGKKILKAKVNK